LFIAEVRKYDGTAARALEFTILSTRAVGWVEAHVDTWIARQIDASRTVN